MRHLQADQQWQEYKRQQETPTRSAKILAVFLLLFGISFLCASCLHFAGYIHTKPGAVRPQRFIWILCCARGVCDYVQFSYDVVEQKLRFT